MPLGYLFGKFILTPYIKVKCFLAPRGMGSSKQYSLVLVDISLAVNLAEGSVLKKSFGESSS